MVCAGDTKIDNHKYKEVFGCKAKMLDFESVEELIGHGVGGVCPFGIKASVKVYLDVSLKRFDKIYPAAGSAVELTLEELELAAEPLGWVDVTLIKV